MKFVLLLCFALMSLFALPYAIAQTSTPVQSHGVRDGTTWKNNSGKKVTVKIKAQTNGNMSVEYTDQNGATGSTTSGTPHSGGGVSESPPVTVGTDTYRIHRGRVQWLNPATGHYADMHQPSGGNSISVRTPVVMSP